MARAKRSSTALNAARIRLSGLKSITPAPDFGPNLQISDYEQAGGTRQSERRRSAKKSPSTG